MEFLDWWIKDNVHTDSKSVLLNTGKFDEEIESWKARIQQYDIVFKHRRGKENLMADELSRRCKLTKEIHINRE